MHLSIVIPAYNEEQHLSSTLKDIAEYLKDKEYDYEVIVVDDGSKDKTTQIASSFSDIFKSFTLIKNSPNRGKGYAVKRGVLTARGDYILFMDADNSTTINHLESLILGIKHGFDIALASRRIKGAEITNSQPAYRILLGNIYILLSKLILGSTVRDYNCGFKLYKKDTAKLIFSKMTRNDWSFDSELIFLASKFNLKSIEVPVRWVDNSKTSKVRPLRDGINSLLSLLAIRFNSIKKVYD